MPLPTVPCRRVYRDAAGELQACDGPMSFCFATGTSTCAWCGRVLNASIRRADAHRAGRAMSGALSSRAGSADTLRPCSTLTGAAGR